jgi:hypothetical protein
MKKLAIMFFAFALLLVNCKKDDDSPSYSFKDQTLSGKIGGTAWSMLSGYASYSVSGQDTTVSFTCYNFASDSPCSATATGDEVSFSLPKKVGVYTLKLDWSDLGNNRTVILFERDSYMNNIASEGAVEIISISDTQIKGRIDATSDTDNTVNGNFTVSLCSSDL